MTIFTPAAIILIIELILREFLAQVDIDGVGKLRVDEGGDESHYR